MIFKTNRNLFVLACATSLLVIGCGGGSSSGGGTPAGTLRLNTEAGEVLANNVSASLPGCTYVSGSSSATAANGSALLLYKSTIDSVRKDRDAQILAGYQRDGSLFQRRARTIDESTQGTCPDLPGVFTIVGSHDNGVDDVVYTFDKYCTESTEGRSVISGTMTVKEVGTPSATGPIPQYSTLSTGSTGLQITETSSDGTFDHTANINGLRATYGNGDEDGTMARPDRLQLTALSITEGRTNKTFGLRNVDVNSYVSGSNDVLEIVNITHVDPDLGSVNISTTPLVIADNGDLISGEIKATGTDNTVMLLNKSSSVTNGFDVVLDDSTKGVMDCSGFELLGTS